MSSDIVGQIIPANLLDILRGSEYSHAQGGALVGNGMEMVKYHLLYLLLHLLHLSEDHAPFSLNLPHP